MGPRDMRASKDAVVAGIFCNDGRCACDRGGLMHPAGISTVQFLVAP